jgi:hypothetical protein
MFYGFETLIQTMLNQNFPIKMCWSLEPTWLGHKINKKEEL